MRCKGNKSDEQTLKYLLSLLIASVFFLSGCDEQNRCYDSVDTQVVVTLRSSDFSIYHNLIVHGINRNASGDTLVNDTLSSQSKRFSLPLSLSADSTGFVFKIGDVKDTIYFHHQITMQFISESCGFAPRYTIDGSSYNKGIDSVRISDPVVNTKSIQKSPNDQNVIVYFNSAFH
jgi:hypothetical protein